MIENYYNLLYQFFFFLEMKNYSSDCRSNDTRCFYSSFTVTIVYCAAGTPHINFAIEARLLA